MSQSSSPFISATIRGNQRRLALWPHGEPTDGALNEVHQMVQRAAHAVSLYDRLRIGIDEDQRLSDSAKREDIKKAALAQLSRIATAHNNLHREATDIDERRNALLEIKPYAQGDFSTVAIDLALAATLRSASTADALKAIQADPRVADAVARLPTTLTGIPESVKARMLNEVAAQRNPGEVKELATLDEALRHARDGLANAARTIAQDANLNSAEFAPFAHIGSGIEALPAQATEAADEPAETA